MVTTLNPTGAQMGNMSAQAYSPVTCPVLIVNGKTSSGIPGEPTSYSKLSLTRRYPGGIRLVPQGLKTEKRADAISRQLPQGM